MSSVRTNLRNAIITCTKEITVAAGYNYDYLQVFDPPINMENMSIFPTVNVLYGRETRQNDKWKTANYGLYDVMLPVQFDIFLDDNIDTSLAQDKAIADLQRYFGKNYYVKPATGDRTVFEIAWLASDIWGTETQTPTCGVSIDFEIYYSFRVNNPDLST